MSAPVVERKKIFFSYTLRDGFVDEFFLKSVNDSLIHSCDVFIDLIHNDSLEKQKRILKELYSSQYVVVLKTPLINQSPWVKIEIDEAQKHNIPIHFVPVHSKDVSINCITKVIFDLINGYKNGK